MANERAREPMIAIRGLHKSFGDHRVLTGVDLAVAEGSTTVILGFLLVLILLLLRV